MLFNKPRTCIFVFWFFARSHLNINDEKWLNSTTRGSKTEFPLLYAVFKFTSASISRRVCVRIWISGFFHIERGSECHNKNFPPRLALKERLGTRKWSVLSLLSLFMRFSFYTGSAQFGFIQNKSNFSLGFTAGLLAGKKKKKHTHQERYLKFASSFTVINVKKQLYYYITIIIIKQMIYFPDCSVCVQ